MLRRAPSRANRFEPSSGLSSLTESYNIKTKGPSEGMPRDDPICKIVTSPHYSEPLTADVERSRQNKRSHRFPGFRSIYA